MPYHRIEQALRICIQHIEQIDSDSPFLSELEAYLVAGVVLLIVSEYEDCIEKIFIKRAEKCGDISVINYVRTTIDQKFRSPDLSKVTEVLGKFGKNYKDQFSKLVLNTEAHAAWDNIMKARHAVVHKKSNLNITLRELQISFPKTKEVLSSLEAILTV
jgi:hypothetical protein